MLPNRTDTVLNCNNEINHNNEELRFSDSLVDRADLLFELRSLRNRNYEVSIGCAADIAYDGVENVQRVFDDLEAKGRLFAEKSNELVLRDLGLTSLRDISPSVLRKSYANKEDQFEEMRASLLFDELKMPWHIQRGSALALQTIVDAHDLIVCDDDCSKEGKYPTMSGKLPYYDKDFVFGDNDGSLSGLRLDDAIILTEQAFNGKSEKEAKVQADASLAKLDSFFRAPVSREFKDIVAYCYDSLGIRSRKVEVCSAISGHIDAILEKDPTRNNLTMLSIGCGTAQAILEVAAEVKSKGIDSKLILLDQDPIALAAAKNHAIQMGLGDSLEIHCERLFNKRGQLLDMTKILNGRSIDVAEDTGLREYLPDLIYRNLTKSVWEQMSDDGIMTTGNMNLNRPQAEFLHGLMGWRPYVIMRSIEQGFALHEESGVPAGKTTARVTRDGVYTLFFSRK